MAVKIRLTRVGRRNDPLYRIVVADSRFSRDGRYIDLVGRYDPKSEKGFVVDKEKVLSWLAKGAKPSDTIKNLLSKEGIIKEFEASKKPAAKKAVKEAK